jgi:hypothetical protein
MPRWLLARRLEDVLAGRVEAGRAEASTLARASGAIWSGCGDHRSAALGARRTLLRRLISNCTLAVR